MSMASVGQTRLLSRLVLVTFAAILIYFMLTLFSRITALEEMATMQARAMFSFAEVMGIGQ